MAEGDGVAPRRARAKPDRGVQDRGVLDRGVRAYLVFEGGGAKGLAYLGVMRAIEKRMKLELEGISGSSAGAVSAALLAAGYKSHELFDPSKPEGERGLLESGIAHLFTSPAFKTAEKGLNNWRRARDAALDWSRWWSGGFLSTLTMCGWQSALGSARLGYAAIALIRRRGLINTDAFVDWLNNLLCEKLGKPRGYPVYFDEPKAAADAHQLDRLKIIVTDLSNHAVAVYPDDAETGRKAIKDAEDAGEPLDKAAPENQRRVTVAEAVAASIAIPLVFQPRTLLNRYGRLSKVVDGGATSNFPYWVFERRRHHENDFRTPVIGVRLRDRARDLRKRDVEYPATVMGLLRTVGDLVSASIAGSDAPERLPVRNITQHSVGVAVDALDFKGADENLKMIVEEAEKDMSEFLRDTPHLAPPNIVDALLDRSTAQLREALDVDEETVLRGNIMLPISDTEHMVYFSCNMQECPDERLILPRSRGVAARVYNKKMTQLRLIDPEDDGDLTPEQRRLIWPELKMVYSIPLFAPQIDGSTEEPDVFGVLNFDSNTDLINLIQEKMPGDFEELTAGIVQRILIR